MYMHKHKKTRLSDKKDSNVIIITITTVLIIMTIREMMPK